MSIANQVLPVIFLVAAVITDFHTTRQIAGRKRGRS